MTSRTTAIRPGKSCSHIRPVCAKLDVSSVAPMRERGMKLRDGEHVSLVEHRCLTGARIETIFVLIMVDWSTMRPLINILFMF